MGRPKFAAFCHDAIAFCSQALLNLPSPEASGAVGTIEKWAELTNDRVGQLKKKHNIDDGQSPVGMGDEDEALWKEFCDLSVKMDAMIGNTIRAAEEWADAQSVDVIQGGDVAPPQVLFLVGYVDKKDPVNAFMRRLSEALKAQGYTSANPTTMTREAWHIRCVMHLPHAVVVVPVLCAATAMDPGIQLDIENASCLHKPMLSLVFDAEGFQNAMSADLVKALRLSGLLQRVPCINQVGNYDHEFEANTERLVKSVKETTEATAPPPNTSHSSPNGEANLSRTILGRASFPSHPLDFVPGRGYWLFYASLAMILSAIASPLETLRIRAQCGQPGTYAWPGDWLVGVRGVVFESLGRSSLLDDGAVASLVQIAPGTANPNPTAL